MLKSIQFFNSPQSYGYGYFISKDEILFSFGWNACGQLSLGDERNRNKPEEVKFKEFYCGKEVFVKKIAFGFSHSLILTKDFRVFGVGRNTSGQLSLGDFKNRNIPTLINCYKKKKIFNVYGGGNHSIFIVENEIFSSGGNFTGQLGIGSNRNHINISQKMKFSEKIKDVEGGDGFTLLISVKNEFFKTGEVYKEGKCLIPMKLIGLKRGEFVTKMSAGSDHFLVLSNSKRVYGFGSNGNDKMTSALPISTNELQLIPCLNGIIDIKVGEFHSIILDENGIAMGIGNTRYFGISKNKDENGIVILKKNIIRIETGMYQTFLFDKNNDVWVGGYNEDGCLGLGHRRNVYRNLQKNGLLKNIKILLSNLIYSINRSSFLDVIIVTRQYQSFFK